MEVVVLNEISWAQTDGILQGVIHVSNMKEFDS